MKRPTYLRAVIAALGTMLKGMRLSGKHFAKGHDRDVPLGITDPDYFQKTQGPITIQYPMQKVAVPDNGRYRLYMETDDCIGCDKCARICPVDCITIETFRADGDLGRTSDGTMKRLHLPTFDIDMAKCMYCGLCTTVCPTECLTMTPVYDYSEYDRDNFLYHFGAYSPSEEGRIRKETEAALAAKKAAKSTAEVAEPQGEPKPKGRPMMRPVTKPAEVPNPPVAESPAETSAPENVPPRPKPRPMMKRREDGDAPAPPIEESTDSPTVPETPPRPRPKPVMKPKGDAPAEDSTPPAEKMDPPATDPPPVPPKTRPRPVMRRPDDQEGGPVT